ncbi:coiled-coil domain-containing protein 9B-like isoform X2 [Ascaphus truei]
MEDRNQPKEGCLANLNVTSTLPIVSHLGVGRQLLHCDAFFNQVATADEEIRKKEQKDAELDKKIQALRKKNEALIRRYQEIEEDKMNAEREGIAVTARSPKQDSLTITITKAPNEKRVVTECWRDTSPDSSDSEEDAEHMFTFRMGNQMQLAVTMDNNVKGKRVVSKKTDQDCHQITRDLSDFTLEETDNLFTYGRGRRMQIAITMEKVSPILVTFLKMYYTFWL